MSLLKRKALVHGAIKYLQCTHDDSMHKLFFKKVLIRQKNLSINARKIPRRTKTI